MISTSASVGIRLTTGHYYLPDMAKASGLRNQLSAGVAAIELVNFNTPNDERDPRHFDIDATASAAYPYRKTRSGALQSHTMPWDYTRKQQIWAGVGLFTGLLGLVCKAI